MQDTLYCLLSNSIRFTMGKTYLAMHVCASVKVIGNGVCDCPKWELLYIIMRSVFSHRLRDMQLCQYNNFGGGYGSGEKKSWEMLGNFMERLGSG